MNDANFRNRPGAIALAALLSATALSTVIAFPAQAQQAGASTDDQSLLETIRINLGKFWTRLGGKATADTGATVYGTGAIDLRASGGDANSALKNSANVQYQSDGSNDAGSDSQDLINTRPQRLSISGGKVYENNFQVNGIGVNTVTGTDEPFGSSGFGSDIDGYTQTPNINKIFGLHPQTVFVPSHFVEEATLLDSNVSARYGGFLGGVVDYRLSQPNTEKAHGSVSFGFTADELTDYTIRTRSGTNIQGLPKPEYGKYESAIEYNLPINDSWAILGQYSRKAATSGKTKDERYSFEEANDRSYNEMYRLASRHDTDYGIFTLDGSFTNYSQIWDGFYYDDLQIDQKTQTLATRLQWERDLDALTLERIGLRNVKLDSNLYFNRSRTANDGGENATTYTTIVSRTATSVTDPTKWFYSTDPDVLSWCKVPTLGSWGTAEYCRSGGYGQKETGQKDTGFKTDMEGDVFAGTFATGLEYRYMDAYRRAEEYTLYSVARTNSTAIPFVCGSDTETCSTQQYNSTRTVTPAYNNNAQLNHFTTYGELDQTWDWLNVRAGLRLDYEDYFKNLDLSPRAVATVKPVDWFSISGGFNRYYNGDSMAYALRDGQPIASASTRTHNATTGIVGPWSTLSTARYYNFDAADVDTPYKDEFTAGLTVTDPWAEGEFRLRFLERRGHDEFIAASGSSSTNVTLTNGGESQYRSLTAEYAKNWDVRHGSLDTIGLLGKVTWSKQKTTTVSAFYDEDENWAWYDGKSYSPAEFDEVRGNLDIPIRATVDLKTSWLDQRLTAGISANVNLGYNGVRGSGTDCTPSTSSSSCRLQAGSTGIGKAHTMYNDYSYRPTVTFDLKAAYRVAESKSRDTAFDVELTVFNLFNDTGNKIAQDDNPWVVGRTVWLGAKATF